MRWETIKVAIGIAIAGMCGCVPQVRSVRATAPEAPVAPQPPGTSEALAIASEAFAGQILATGSAALDILDVNDGNGTSGRDWVFGFESTVGLQINPAAVLFGANVLLGTRERASITEPVSRRTTITILGAADASLSPP